MMADVIDDNSTVSPRLRSEVKGLRDIARQFSGLSQNPMPREQLEKAGIVVSLSLVSEIHYLNRLKANAYARIVEGRPVVMVLVGLPLLIRAFFLAIMSEGKVLSNTEDISCANQKMTKRYAECDWRGFLCLARQFSIDKFERWCGRLALTGLPQNNMEGRTYLAIMLSLQAVCYVLGHEIGHVAMGHVDFVGGEKEDFGYAEFPGLKRLPFSTSLFHAFEFEADTYAIAKMFEGFFQSNSAISMHPKTSKNYISLTTMSRQSRYQLWITTIGAIFLLFESLQKLRPLWAKVICPGYETHPPPLYRLKHLVKWTREFYLRSEGRDREQYDRATAYAIKDLSLIAEKLRIKANFHNILDSETGYEMRIAAARGSVAEKMKEIMQSIQDRYAYGV
jgi:hypothetical protein